MSRSILTCLLAAGVAVAAGCQTCRRADYSTARPPCNGCGDAVPGGRLKPVPHTPPPSRLPPVQPPIARLDHREPPLDRPPAEKDGNEPAPFPSTPLSPDDAPIPNPVRAYLGMPRLPGEGDRPPLTKETDEPPPAANIPGKPGPKDDPPATKDDRAKGDDTAALLNYKVVFGEVASGIRPDAKESAWLKAKGYRTVLYLHSPGINARDRKQTAEKQRPIVEEQGMKYLALAASPVSLVDPKEKLYETFVKIVEDTGDHPLYVCDDATGVAGGLWYLYFRLQKNYSVEDARREAKRLGLDFDNTEGEAGTMAVAVESFLKRYKR